MHLFFICLYYSCIKIMFVLIDFLIIRKLFIFIYLYFKKVVFFIFKTCFLRLATDLREN